MAKKSYTLNPFARSRPGIKADRQVLDLIKHLDKTKKSPAKGKLTGKFPPNLKGGFK